MLPVNSKHDMNRVNPDLETDKAYLEFAEPSATMASTTASVASKTREAQQVCIHASYYKLNYVIGMDDKNQTVQGMYRKKLPQKSEHFGDIKTRETASKKTASKKRRLLFSTYYSTTSSKAILVFPCSHFTSFYGTNTTLALKKLKNDARKNRHQKLGETTILDLPW